MLFEHIIARYHGSLCFVLKKHVADVDLEKKGPDARLCGTPSGILSE